MEDKKTTWLEKAVEQTQLQQVLDTNQYTQKFGLALTREETELLMAEKTQTLKAERRVEFGQTILPRIILAFCDSDYINQSNYCETLVRLQDIFYAYKNEMLDEITDDELLEFMKEQFETVCFGDLDYLEGTCLDLFAQAIRAGYSDYAYSDGRGQFSRFDIVTRWDRELYLQVLRNEEGE